MQMENIVKTLFESLLSSYEYLIIFGDNVDEGVDDGVCDGVFGAQNVEAQGEGTPRRRHNVMLRQSKADNPPSRQGVITCFYCGKADHISQFCYKSKNKERENAKNAKDEDEFTFAMQYKAHTRSVCKWIMDLGATKHMTSHRAA